MSGLPSGDVDIDKAVADPDIGRPVAPQDSDTRVHTPENPVSFIGWTWTHLKTRQ